MTSRKTKRRSFFHRCFGETGHVSDGGINLKDGVGVRPMAGEAMKMASYIKFAGKSYSTPTKVTIAFESYHYRTFQYTVDRDLTIKTPNQKYSFGKMDLTGRRSESMAFYETLELAVP
jgi:hypothetical protein